MTLTTWGTLPGLGLGFGALEATAPRYDSREELGRTGGGRFRDRGTDENRWFMMEKAIEIITIMQNNRV